ncbi:MAG: glycosyltransferase [Verrucomicrobiaceae bacterium]|nr:glycosyltransferase [Verrucomicrobiaceae bacterium]
MSKLSRRFFGYLARRLSTQTNLKSDLVNKEMHGKLRREVGSLRDKVLKLRSALTTLTTERQSTYAARSGEPEPVLFQDEQAMYDGVMALWRKGQVPAALRLLDANAGKTGRLDELRAVQAWLAFQSNWVPEAVGFLEAMVEAAEKKRSTMVWGPTAIISNSYWSRAMNAAGVESKTLMVEPASINRRDDYDLYYEDVMPAWFRFKDRDEMWAHGTLPYMLAFLYVIRHASVVHVPCTGSVLGQTDLWEYEAQLFKRAGIKSVILPYGGDYYCYSRVQDPCVRHGLLSNYAAQALIEPKIQARVTYWQQHGDAVLAGYMVDAMGRWDVALFTFFHIDTSLWQARQTYSGADGRNGAVRVMHTPNHRGFKGTEFLVHAVEELKKEGLQIELVLLERVPNSEVRRLMSECDILAEQFIATAYALSGIEGMASGLAVMANLHDEYYTRIYRRYSFLNECPIFSTTPEILKENLRILVTRPALREALGRAGREYVEKYHSFPAAQHLFGKIHDRILRGKEEDIINLYHPLTSESARTRPPVKHPLLESRLPKDSPYLKEP